MSRARSWMIACLVLIALLPVVPTASAATQRLGVAPALVEQINQSGAGAHQLWLSLSRAQQRSVLDYLQPEFHQRGLRGTLMSVVFVPTPDAAPSALATDSLAYTIRNVTQCCTYMPLATYVSGNAPAGGSATLSLSIQDSVSNSWSANVGVTASMVSASVGFNVTTTRTVQYSYAITMPPNTRWQINAYNQFRHYDYEVWSGTTRVGNGYARKFLGVYYYAFQV